MERDGCVEVVRLSGLGSGPIESGWFNGCIRRVLSLMEGLEGKAYFANEDTV